MAPGASFDVARVVFAFIMAASVTRCRGLQLGGGSNSSYQEAVRPDADPSELAAGGSAARSAVSEALDIAYDTGPKNKVDLYWSAHQPKRPKQGWPAVIIFHGKGGSKKGYMNFCKHHIVLTGRLCVASDYRTDDQNREKDVYKMVTWFWEKGAQKYKVDKSNIVLGGYSQGGLTINNIIWDRKGRGEDLLAGSKPKVKAVMLLCGVWNHHKNAKRADYFPKSTFILSSDTDTKVPFKYSEQLYKTLDKMGKKVSFKNVSGAGHNPMHSKQKDEFYDSILRWLGKTVPGAKR